MSYLFPNSFPGYLDEFRYLDEFQRADATEQGDSPQVDETFQSPSHLTYSVSDVNADQEPMDQNPLSSLSERTHALGHDVLRPHANPVGIFQEKIAELEALLDSGKITKNVLLEKSSRVSSQDQPVKRTRDDSILTPDSVPEPKRQKIIFDELDRLINSNDFTCEVLLEQNAKPSDMRKKLNEILVFLIDKDSLGLDFAELVWPGGIEGGRLMSVFSSSSSPLTYDLWEKLTQAIEFPEIIRNRMDEIYYGKTIFYKIFYKNFDVKEYKKNILVLRDLMNSGVITLSVLKEVPPISFERTQFNYIMHEIILCFGRGSAPEFLGLTKSIIKYTLFTGRYAFADFFYRSITEKIHFPDDIAKKLNVLFEKKNWI